MKIFMSKFKKLKVLAILSLVVLQTLMGTVPASAALAEVGPTNPTTGFPEWYRDSNGLTLDLMEAADPMGISDPVDPGNPFSQTIGFNAEGFWWSAESQIGTQARLVLALEAAFAGEAAVDGEQSAFGRIRYRITGLTPGETYTVRHPFGNTTEVADGGGVINVTTDIGGFGFPGFPANFNIPLSSGIGPFLTWDTFNTNPALTDPALVNPLPQYTGRQYVGNPVIDHTITGSPIGQNFFRVEGPGLPGGAIENNLFSVSGRLVQQATALTVTVNAQTATTATPTITGTVSDPAATVSVAVGTQAPVNATVNPDGTWSSTVVTALTDGIYEVVATATNATGTTTDTTANELTVNTAGPAIPIVTVNAQTAATATPTITGTVSDPAATVSVTVGTQPAINATITGNTWSATVTAPLDNGTYEVAATATNAAGTGTDTTTNELTVNVALPAQLAISNIQVTNITDDGATITWTTNIPSTGNVEHATNSRLSRPTTVSDTTTGTDHAVALTGLGSSRTVYFRVNAVTDTQTAQSAIEQFRTLRRGTSPTAFTIANVQVTDITASSATITWTTSVPTTGTVVVDRSRSFREPVATVSDPVSGITHSAAITNLTPGRTFFFKITATDGTSTVESAPERFRTNR